MDSKGYFELIISSAISSRKVFIGLIDSWGGRSCYCFYYCLFSDINQKAFAVDHKALVSHGDPQQSLEVFNRDEGCPSITLPICACVEWETVAGGKGGAELPKGYLFKGNIYEGRVLDQSVASTFELRLEVLSFGGQNPGYLGIVRLDNSTAATLNYGDVVYFSYTDDCNPKIIKTMY